MVVAILAILYAKHAQGITIALLAIVAITPPHIGAILANRNVKHAMLIRRALRATMAIISKTINV